MGRHGSGDGLAAILFVALSSLAAHLAFSWIGFNPTDDGFVLAYSRRLLEGQIPHRDFISIRPALPAFLHAPIVAWGGESTLWISRLVVWVEWAITAWAFVAIPIRLLDVRVRVFERFTLALVVMGFCSFNFPVMAWHSIDALLLASVGLACCVRGAAWKAPGYFLLGCSYLCRQNFLLVAPAALVILGDWRRWRYVLAAASPGIAYVAGLAWTGAFKDAVEQLGAQTGWASTGVVRYMRSRAFWVGLSAGVGGALLIGRDARAVGVGAGPRWRAAGALLFFCLVTAAVAWSIAAGRFVDAGAFAAMGAALGLAGAAPGLGRSALARAGIVASLLAWSVSVSIGMNSPALAAGAPVAFLLAAALQAQENAGAWRRARPTRGIALGAAALIVVYCCTAARLDSVYRDRPARELTAPLDGALAGGRRIWTNPTTRDYLLDLEEAIGKAAGRPYAILPDCCAHWIRSPRINPLSIDWPQGTELNTRYGFERVAADLEGRGRALVILVGKVRADSLAHRLEPVPSDGYFTLVGHVREHFRKIDETRYFDLYVP